MKFYAPLNSELVPKLQEIEVATFFQLPNFQIIGLPGPEISEAKERIRSAIEASGQEFPKKRVILNLAPASVKKRGTGLDLAMALSVLLLGNERSDSICAWGELGLDGGVRPVGQMTRALYAAWKKGVKYFIFPHEDWAATQRAREKISESGELKGKCPYLLPICSLLEAWEMLRSRTRKRSIHGTSASAAAALASGEALSQYPWTAECARAIQAAEKANALGNPSLLGQVEGDPHSAPLGEIRTSSEMDWVLLPISPSLARTIGVAVAGQHHCLFLGPRGTGKSQALNWFSSLHPMPSPEDLLKQCLTAELAQFYSMGSLPVRRIGAQVRPEALIGGVTFSSIRPGEFSLAHGGLLLADELPEWSRDSRESLREPLERGKVTLTRTNGSYELPARFLMAGNGNLCPCGGWPPEVPMPETVGLSSEVESIRENFILPRCKCTFQIREKYLQRLSGPVLDRVGMVVLLLGVAQSVQSGEKGQEQLQTLKDRVYRCRKQLISRYGKPSGILGGGDLEDLLLENPQLSVHLNQVASSSLRSRHQVLRTALTLAEWDGASGPEAQHFIEAAYYRPEKLPILR